MLTAIVREAAGLLGRVGFQWDIGVQQALTRWARTVGAYRPPSGQCARSLAGRYRERLTWTRTRKPRLAMAAEQK